MEILHIIYIGKNGGSVKTIVDRASFENNYKPAGWQIDKNFHEVKEEDENIEKFKTQEEIKNYTRMKKTKPQPFDDGLIKKE